MNTVKKMTSNDPRLGSVEIWLVVSGIETRGSEFSLGSIDEGQVDGQVDNASNVKAGTRHGNVIYRCQT